MAGFSLAQKEAEVQKPHTPERMASAMEGQGYRFVGMLAEESGYVSADYHESSNIALLCSDRQSAGKRIIPFDG